MGRGVRNQIESKIEEVPGIALIIAQIAFLSDNCEKQIEKRATRQRINLRPIARSPCLAGP